MVELVKILEKRFKKQYSISDISGIYKSSFADYKKDRRNELIALFKNLGLEESLDMFKSVEGRFAKVRCGFVGVFFVYLSVRIFLVNSVPCSIMGNIIT